MIFGLVIGTLNDPHIVCCLCYVINNFLYYFRVNLEDRRVKDVSSTSNTTKFDEPYDNILNWPISRQTCIIMYAILNIFIIVATFIRSAALESFFMKTFENLHNNMFNAIIRSTMHFFNTNSSGKCPF